MIPPYEILDALSSMAPISLSALVYNVEVTNLTMRGFTKLIRVHLALVRLNGGKVSIQRICASTEDRTLYLSDGATNALIRKMARL
jgi:hypothetical protein